MGDEILDRVRVFARRDEPAAAAEPSAEPEAIEVTDTTAETEGADQMAKTESEQVAAEETPEAAASGAPATNGTGNSASGSLSAPGAIRGAPLPAGAVIFGELTSAFVDGPRLLRFLGDRKHTGALVDAGGSGTQVAVLHEGNVVALVGTTGGAGADARRLDRLALPGPGASDEHELTVLTYRPEVSIALGQLVNLPERFERMHGSFVDLPALLAFLKREKANGAVRVSTRNDTGIVLLRGGEVLGAFTRQKPELEDAEIVYPLAKETDAEIDVHVGALTVPPPSVSVSTVV